MPENWVNIAIPENVQKQAKDVDEPYHRLIDKGIRMHEQTDDEQAAIEIMREKLDEWEDELR